MFRQAFHELVLATRGRGLVDFTGAVEKWVAENKFRDGLLTLHLRHTSASLLIQENADPDVRRDLDAFFARLVPDGDSLFVHTAEGDDDMAAHLRTALTAASSRWGRGRGFIYGNTARSRTPAAWRCTSSENNFANFGRPGQLAATGRCLAIRVATQAGGG